jgi:predicted RNA-binding Zn ribbon-like protein
MITPVTEPFIIADHPVLDMLNTIATRDGFATDFWQSDADVYSWMKRIGLRQEPAPRFAKGTVLEAAKTLREAVRALVEQRKAGLRGNPTTLNSFLIEAASHSQLVWETSAEPRLTRIAERQSPEQSLAPLSEQAAELLCHGDFTLVRQCEHPDCTLWFYDRTKAHRRRWCTMALCGNRHKVAEHRKRQYQK